jgi:cytochrome c oxidase assembly protein subunit 15
LEHNAVKEKDLTTDSTSDKMAVAKRHCYLLLTASVMTYLLITMGGVVCVTNSGQGCPDWPGCYGQIIPPLRMDAIIEYTHRLIAALTSPFIIAAAIVGWWKYRPIRWVSRPPVIAVALLFAVVVFGAFAVLTGLPPWIAAIDLGSALLVLALLLIATVMAFSHHYNPNRPDRLWFHSSFAQLSMWTLVAVFIVLVSGVLIAKSGSIVRCLGWPLYSIRLIPVDLHGWLQMARFLIAGVASILIVAVVVQAWRTQRRQTAILRTAILVGVLFLAEMMIETLMLLDGFTIVLLVAYVATAAALWAFLVVLVVLAGLASPHKPST